MRCVLCDRLCPRARHTGAGARRRRKLLAAGSCRLLLSSLRYRPQRRCSASIPCWARQLALEVRESVDDVRGLVSTVAPADRNLMQDPRLNKPLDRIIRRLERAPDQSRGAVGGKDRGTW